MMANTRPGPYAPPLKPMEKRHPPPTPPRVSVEAIKRALVHTPSPRRFKKLRLRRLQERLRREETEAARQVLRAGNMGEFGGGGDAKRRYAKGQQ